MESIYWGHVCWAGELRGICCSGGTGGEPGCRGWEWAEGQVLEGEDFPGGRNSTCQVGRSRCLEGMERGKWDGHVENGAVWMRCSCEQGQARPHHLGPCRSH